jgi:uncharacterized protein
MPMTIDTLIKAPRSEGAITSGIIDCDVHPQFDNGLADLIPYMTESWRQRLGFGSDVDWSKTLAAAQFVLPLDNLYINTAGPQRGDASPPGGRPPGSDPDFMAAQLLDTHGIERAVLIAGQLFGIGSFPDAEVAAVVASAYNDWQQERWLEHDMRYRGAIVVPPQHPGAAVKEIERMADKPGIVAVFLPLHEIAAGKYHYYPIYEAAQKHALPVVFHPAGTENVYANAPRMAAAPTYYLEWHSGLGQIHQSNLMSMVCHGVFEKFPDLKILIAEGGFMWAIETMYKLDRDWMGLRDEVPWLNRPPSEYIRGNVRFTTQPFPEPHDKAHLGPILEMVYAEETLVFSSDYPHWDFDDPQRVLSGIDPALRRKICVDNGRALFGDRLN